MPDQMSNRRRLEERRKVLRWVLREIETSLGELQPGGINDYDDGARDRLGDLEKVIEAKLGGLDGRPGEELFSCEGCGRRVGEKHKIQQERCPAGYEGVVTRAEADWREEGAP